MAVAPGQREAGMVADCVVPKAFAKWEQAAGQAKKGFQPGSRKVWKKQIKGCSDVIAEESNIYYLNLAAFAPACNTEFSVFNLVAREDPEAAAFSPWRKRPLVPFSISFSESGL